MKAKELRELSIEELKEKHKQYKEELFNLRFQNAVGQLSNLSKINETKKTIAKILTVITEKEMGIDRSGARR
ncbi:MAG: 50S ribosomal protein L29 [Synergistes sp.]|nr:50S ribosomal protein L29 [Synergistes sp.]